MERSIRISVVVPVFNAASFITEAIESVLSQSHDVLEIVVVDDGSTDDSHDVLANATGPIRIFRQSNQGPSAARNRGIRESKGNVIAFLDADDLWAPGKLEAQILRLQEDEELDVVLGRVRYVGDLNAVEQNLRFEAEDQSVINVNLGSGLFRRRVFDRVGYFAEELRHFEDHDWFLRARESGVRMTILPAVTLFYRRHEASTTRMKGSDVSIASVLRRAVARRREQGLADGVRMLSDYDENKSGGDGSQ